MRTWMKYLRDILVGAGAFLYTAYSRGLMSTENVQNTFGILSDCFVIPGIILTGVGLISYVSRLGTFDMLSYCASNIFPLHKDKSEDFYTYKCRRASTRSSNYTTLWLGIAFLAAAGIFLVIYMLV